MAEQKICPTCGTEYPLSERFCPRDGTALRSANVQADLLGSIVADRYHILKKLGEGGMGTVYLAEHVKMGRKSALKVMNPGMNTDPDAIARFNREASNASRLSHPNICGIYDFGETSDGLIYLAMEFIEGSSLTSLIEKAGALPAARCGSIIHQAADALQVAHDAGIVHRDLKPDNIMVARNRDGSDLVKVVDFGIAKASSSDAQKVTKTGLVVGTPEYMSPEQLAGDKLDGRSDIYSLGLVAFNCLTGKLPFPAETVQEAMIMRLTDKPRTLAETVPGVSWPEELQRTLDKAIERDEGARYQSASQFGREFAAAISAMPATQAMEAGTMIVGAAAPPREVPATRVRASSSATKAMDVPDVPARKPATAAAPAVERRKSSFPLIAGAVGSLAAVGIIAFVWLKPGPDTVGGNGITDAGAGIAAADTTSGSAPEAQPLSRRTGEAPALPPGTQTETKSASTPPVTTPATTIDPEDDPATVAPRLTRMLNQVLAPTTTEGELRAGIRTIERMRANQRLNLTPRLRADLFYIEMMAYGALYGMHGEAPADRTKACELARRVQQHPDELRAGAGRRALEDLECTP